MDKTNRKGLIVYSSKTGNTRKIAEGIYRGLASRGITARIGTVEEAPVPGEDEWVLAGFWADRGAPDEKAADYIKTLRERDVGLFGTLGAYPDSNHAASLTRKAEELVSAQNTCLGAFLCQGKIDPKLTEQFMQFPEGHPHYMDEERKKRHAEAAKHPNSEDIEKALEACILMLKKAGITELC
jgi:flavodoxin